MSFLDAAGVESLIEKISTKARMLFQRKLVSGTNIKTIDGDPILGSGNIVTKKNWVGTCSSSASVINKVVTVTGNFELKEGAVITIAFTNANTATSPKLRINDTRATLIVKGNSTTPTTPIVWGQNDRLTFLYNGTYYLLIAHQRDDNGKTVLWENASPTSTFAAQTQTMSDSAANYDFLLFEFYYSTTGLNLQTQLVGADYTGTVALRIQQAGANRTGGRNCTVSGTSVEFEAASFNGSTSNTSCIPYRIIGIRL